MIFKIDAALLEAIVLAVVSADDIYGYKITREMRGIMELSDSTLYPVLRRLKKYGLLDSYDMEYKGKLRCYYKITENGKTQLEQYRAEWSAYCAKIDGIFDKAFIKEAK